MVEGTFELKLGELAKSGLVKKNSGQVKSMDSKRPRKCDCENDSFSHEATPVKTGRCSYDGLLRLFDRASERTLFQKEKREVFLA